MAILTEAGLDGCQAHVLYAATEGIDPSVLADNRGWSADDWDQAGRALRARDLLAPDGTPTEAGHDLHAAIEHRTDELATPPYLGWTPRTSPRCCGWRPAWPGRWRPRARSRSPTPSACLILAPGGPG